VKLLFRTDVHVADHAPAAWKADYRAEILDCLKQIGKLAADIGAECVLDGGDFFHVKAASRTSHGLMVQVAEIHRDYPCPVYAVVGNHDISYNNIETIDRQPLGVLFAAGLFRPLDSVSMCGGVRIVGVPYSPTRTLEDLTAIRKQPGDRVLVAVVHALATENPDRSVDELFGEPVFRYSDLIMPDGPDVWMFGHWHRDQGAMRVKGKWFVNPGSVSRGSLVQDNLTRVPKVAVIDVDEDTYEITVELVELNVLPADHVFDLERKERLEAESDEISNFVGKLRETALGDSTASIEDYLSTLDFAKDVRDTALEYLERARMA
jgi:exonuclease SbcD